MKREDPNHWAVGLTPLEIKQRGAGHMFFCVLRHCYGDTYKKIGAALGCSAERVRQMMIKAKHAVN